MAVRIRLGDSTFDADARQLVRDGKEIHLSPKAFDLLKLLIEQRPRALSKQELHAHLWPATFVSDTNLATLIAEIREALGDTARRSHFIRTAHRFGYAFSGEAVEEAVAPAGDAPPVGAGRRPGHEPTDFCWLVKDGKRLPLGQGENILGRESDEGCIRIDSPTVSRRHARIWISSSGVSLEDLDSKNGTYLKGEPVSTPVTLADGDEIRVGSIALRFRMARASQTATWTDAD
jgi:DNA-binding winged helix-turn-helix (wHTH) protein